MTNKKPNEEIEKLKKESGEYKNNYLRALADYRNLEKRMLDERQDLYKSANTQLILKLLPFLDHLEKAEFFNKDQGLKIIREDYLKILKDLGLEEIAVLDQEFDPYLSEAVDVVEGERDNIIMEVVRKGYKFAGRILRVAQVKVSKNPKSQISNLKNKV